MARSGDPFGGLFFLSLDLKRQKPNYSMKLLEKCVREKERRFFARFFFVSALNFTGWRRKPKGRQSDLHKPPPFSPF
jgi:hypothetical protein